VGRRIEAPDSPRRDVYAGRFRYGKLRSPKTYLEFFDSGIRLQVKTILGPFGAPWEFRYEELTGASLVAWGSWHLSYGVRLHTDVATQPPVFITVDGDAILDLFEQRGVRVSRDPAPVSDGLVGLLTDHPALLICFFCIAGPLTVVGAVLATMAANGGQQNLQTLRGDLGRVHLAPQYRLTAEHTTGTDCHTSCSVIQTWTWLPVGGRTASDQCRDASRALSSAFSDAEANSPFPASAVCDYFTIVASFFHPAQGKRDIEAIVTRRSAGLARGFVIQLSASYDG
jgi:hypothetical protein